MTICPNCGFDSRVGKFCINCGQPLPEENNPSQNQNTDNVNNNSKDEFQRPNHNNLSQDYQEDKNTQDYTPLNNTSYNNNQNYQNTSNTYQDNNTTHYNQNNNLPYNQQQNPNQFNNQYRNQKSKVLGFILNFFLPGLGYGYVGKWGEGIAIFVLSWIMNILGFFLLFPFLITLIIWLYSTIKTFEMIDKYNQGLPY